LLFGLIAEVLEELGDLNRLLGLTAIAKAAKAVTDDAVVFSHPELVLREGATAKLCGLRDNSEVGVDCFEHLGGGGPIADELSVAFEEVAVDDDGHD